MNIYKSYLLTILTVIILVGTSCLPSYHYLAKVDNEKAGELVAMLKESPLLWVYKTDYAKQNYYRKLIAQGVDIEKNKIKLDESIDEQQQVFELYRKSFQEKFSFTDVYSIPDSTYKNGIETLAYVYDLNGEMQDLDKIGFKGFTAIMPQYKEFTINYNDQPVPQPFPSVVEGDYYLKSYADPLERIFKPFFGKGESKNINATRRLDRSFHRFYNETHYER